MSDKTTIMDRIVGFGVGSLFFAALSATAIYIHNNAPPMNYGRAPDNYRIQDLNNNGIPEEFYLETGLDGTVDTVFKSIDGVELKNYLKR